LRNGNIETPTHIKTMPRRMFVGRDGTASVIVGRRHAGPGNATDEIPPAGL
jgi:hypothetical protein